MTYERYAPGVSISPKSIGLLDVGEIQLPLLVERP